MAEPSSLTQHIEAFVDSSRSVTQQSASLEAVVALVKNDVISIGSLVKEMEMYLTTTDDIIRARGILLLGEVLTYLSSKPIENAYIHSLISFFKERLADWRALRGALVGCLALMRRKSGGKVGAGDAKSVAQSFLDNLQVQSLAQHDRKLCFELLECLLEKYPDTVASLGEDLVFGICESIDGEKDPQCLMLTFHIVEALARLFPKSSGPVASYASDLFGILGCYFPIHFTHPNVQDATVQRDDLSRALMLAFSSTPFFEPFAMPLLFEKLSSSLPSAKIDSLKYLNYCTLKYGPDRISKHSRAIWSSVKDVIYNSGEGPDFSFTSESSDGVCFKKNEIVDEALALLEKVVVQNHEFFYLIITDEGVKMILNNMNSYKSYDEIPQQSKQKLHSVGRILYVSAKASVISCNKAFETIFPSMLEAIGLPNKKTAGAYSLNDNGVISKQCQYGPLYLCIQLLWGARQLIMNSKDLHLTSSNEKWCCSIMNFSDALSNIFCSITSTCTDDPIDIPNIYFGVKGLQVLATFPGGSSPISLPVFDNILMNLVSIVTKNFNNAFLWKLAMKALVYAGSFSHAISETEKATSYMDVVVENIVLLVSLDDCSMPFSLKLEAMSEIGTCGPKYMLKIFQRLEEFICSNLSGLNVQQNPVSARILLQLLECYSSRLLPWIRKNEGFEEVLLRFVVRVWSTCESGMLLPTETHKEVLDAITEVMKIAVSCCSVESQKRIIDQAYGKLLSSTSLHVKSLSMPVQEALPIKMTEKTSTRDEWLHSLFASVVIALRPDTPIPNMREILHLFMSMLLRGHVTAAQALGSVVNKMNPKSSGGEAASGCTSEKVIDTIFSTKISILSNDDSSITSNGSGISLTDLCLSPAFRESMKKHAVVGLAWIGKGLIMRGHEKAKDVTTVFVECLSNGRPGATSLIQDSNKCNENVHDCIMRSAADAFQILMSDSETCFNRTFHAIIRPLYKQRFYSTIVPILQSLIVKSDSILSRSMLYRAFAHVISDTPLVVVVNDSKKLLVMLLECISLLRVNIVDKDILYGLLLVLSGILTEKTGQEAVVENAHLIIDCLIGLIAYPHKMVVRETAIQCLIAVAALPHARIYPMRIKVLEAIKQLLDDPKRVVRQEAARCRHAWSAV